MQSDEKLGERGDSNQLGVWTEPPGHCQEARYMQKVKSRQGPMSKKKKNPGGGLAGRSFTENIKSEAICSRTNTALGSCARGRGGNLSRRHISAIRGGVMAQRHHIMIQKQTNRKKVLKDEGEGKHSGACGPKAVTGGIKDKI